jgi:quercetin dioxygenase-like cupin family protein/heme-degrading monooxygenase HmoA
MSNAPVTIWNRSHVFRPDELPAKDRGSGARTTPLATAARGATTFLNGITRFEPGAAIAHHRHNVTESVMVVRGDAVVDIDGARTTLRTFDTTLVPANIPHHFENASADAPMAIFWTYGSVDATRTIVATGEHTRIDVEQGGDGADRPVHEVATIRVKAGAGEKFESAVAAAGPLFQAAHGARTLTLERCEEDPLEYRLVVGWNSVDDHVERFRRSEAFAQWRALIADLIETPPRVAHFRTALTLF